MGEQWLPVVGYESTHEISNQGNIKSRGKPLKTYVTKTGRIRVGLYVGGTRKQVYVHRLVAEAFIGPCPQGMECCHNDGNPKNNHVENLRWDTKSSNQRDKEKHGTNHELNKTHCKRGHPLQEPNLRRVPPSKRHRVCLACDRANAYARKYSVSDVGALADRKYIEIMGTVATPTAT